jgi:hypothetical protein
MSFASVINTILQGNDALNKYLDRRIYSYNLPDNLDISKSAIVFNYKKETGTHTLQDYNVLEDYILYVAIVAPTTEITEEIAPLVRAVLDPYDDANIRDIVFDNDQNGVDQEKERYYKILEYKVTFQQ